MNSAVDQEEPMLTAAEVAQRARIKRRTVYRLIAAGRLPAARVGGQWRVPLRACRALLAARVQANAMTPAAVRSSAGVLTSEATET